VVLWVGPSLACGCLLQGENARAESKLNELAVMVETALALPPKRKRKRKGK
jgi:hypothetical protein